MCSVFEFLPGLEIFIYINFFVKTRLYALPCCRNPLGNLIYWRVTAYDTLLVFAHFMWVFDCEKNRQVTYHPFAGCVLAKDPETNPGMKLWASFYFQQSVLFSGPFCPSLSMAQVIYRRTILFPTEYLGCYGDDKKVGPLNDVIEQRALPFQIQHFTGKRDCINQCYGSGYKYAGLQNGDLCFCGKDFDKYGRLDDAQCNIECRKPLGGPLKFTENFFQSCGGRWANSVYSGEWLLISRQRPISMWRHGGHTVPLLSRVRSLIAGSLRDSALLF